MNQEDIQKAAYARWEAEGQHERHWREAEEDITSRSGDDDYAPAPSPDHGGGLSSGPGDVGTTSSEAIPARGNGQEGFKPGELAPESK